MLDDSIGSAPRKRLKFQMGVDQQIQFKYNLRFDLFVEGNLPQIMQGAEMREEVDVLSRNDELAGLSRRLNHDFRLLSCCNYIGII
jgi:hypothetical protein